MKTTLRLLLLLAIGQPVLRGEAPHAIAPPALPLPVASFGAAGTPTGEIYIYGGHSGVRHRYNKEEVHGDLFTWKKGLEQWLPLPAGEPAQGASLLAHEGKFIRIGGMAARNEQGKSQELWSSNTAAMYSPETKTWSPLPDLPERRSSHDSVIIGKTLYVIAGWQLGGGTRTGGGVEPVWLGTYLTLDLSNEGAKWQSHPQPFKRRALAVQALGTKLYAIGGMTDGDEPTSVVSVLDTEKGTWSEAPALPQERLGGFGFAAIAHEGRLFASGVTGELLELRGNAWESVAKLKHPRFFHRFVSGGAGILVALGGESREGEKAPPEVIELPATGSTVLAPEAPAKSSRPASPAPVWPEKVASAESDWPGYQGPRGDSTTPEVGWRTQWPDNGPPIAWEAKLGQGLASFAVVGDRVFTAGNNGKDEDTIWCLDLRTGKPIWEHKLAVRTRAHEMPIVPYGPASTPALVAGKLYFISREGDLLCLDADKGTVVWQKHLINDLGGKRPMYGYSSSPSVKDSRLYLDIGKSAETKQGGSTVCLNAGNGEAIWQTGEGEAGYATPFITEREGKPYVVLYKGEALEVRSAADGALVGRHPTQTRDFCNCATPIRHDDLLFISHTGNMGSRAVAWDDLALTEVWTQRGLGLLFQSGLPWQGHLLVFNDEKRGENDLRLIDLATGESRWQTAEIDKGTGLLCDDGNALFLTSKGELVHAQISAQGIDVKNRAQILSGKSWVQPVLSHRHLLCKNNEGTTVCLNLSLP